MSLHATFTLPVPLRLTASTAGWGFALLAIVCSLLFVQTAGAPLAMSISRKPSATAATPGATSVPPATAATPAGKLVAGSGLPKPVAAAYADGKAIVLFVFTHRGIDDAAMGSSVERLRARSDLAVFITRASRIARYARITEGVDVNRVPALIVVRPRKLNHGVPTASVSYGFRGPDTVDQVVRDALYNGPTNLPYYPQ